MHLTVFGRSLLPPAAAAQGGNQQHVLLNSLSDFAAKKGISTQDRREIEECFNAIKDYDVCRALFDQVKESMPRDIGLILRQLKPFVSSKENHDVLHHVYTILACTPTLRADSQKTIEMLFRLFKKTEAGSERSEIFTALIVLPTDRIIELCALVEAKTSQSCQGIDSVFKLMGMMPPRNWESAVVPSVRLMTKIILPSDHKKFLVHLQGVTEGKRVDLIKKAGTFIGCAVQFSLCIQIIQHLSGFMLKTSLDMNPTQTKLLRDENGPAKAIAMNVNKLANHYFLFDVSQKTEEGTGEEIEAENELKLKKLQASIDNLSEQEWIRFIQEITAKLPVL